MAPESNLEQAMDVLHDMYGETFSAGLEDGKAEMAQALRDRLGLSEHDAKRTGDALVEARSVRWEGRPPGIPNQEGQAITGPPIILGTWHL